VKRDPNNPGRIEALRQTGQILSNSAYVLGFALILFVMLFASGAMASPTAEGSRLILWIGLLTAFLIPPIVGARDCLRKGGPDWGRLVGLVGMALLWVPIYLETMFGEQPDLVMDLVFVGVALGLASIFWPPPKMHVDRG
jgi:hypothetical protein